MIKDFEERDFWKQVYIACIRSRRAYDAKQLADEAVKALQEATAPTKGNMWPEIPTNVR